MDLGKQPLLQAHERFLLNHRLLQRLLLQAVFFLLNLNTLPLDNQMLVLQVAFRFRLRLLDRFLGADVGEFAGGLELVADLGFQLAAQFVIDDEDLRDLHHIDANAPTRLPVPAVRDLAQGGGHGFGQGRLALFDALGHGHVRDLFAQREQAHALGVGVDLRHACPGAPHRCRFFAGLARAAKSGIGLKGGGIAQGSGWPWPIGKGCWVNKAARRRFQPWRKTLIKRG